MRKYCYYCVLLCVCEGPVIVLLFIDVGISIIVCVCVLWLLVTYYYYSLMAMTIIIIVCIIIVYYYYYYYWYWLLMFWNYWIIITVHSSTIIQLLHYCLLLFAIVVIYTIDKFDLYFIYCYYCIYLSLCVVYYCVCCWWVVIIALFDTLSWCLFVVSNMWLWLHGIYYYCDVRCRICVILLLLLPWLLYVEDIVLNWRLLLPSLPVKLCVIVIEVRPLLSCCCAGRNESPIVARTYVCP